MVYFRLTDAFNHIHMGMTGNYKWLKIYVYFNVYVVAENVAEACGITRQEQDEFALRSQLKCGTAVSLEHFDTEIEPIIISSAKRSSILLSIFPICYCCFSRQCRN
jgi:acetyl-CoA acetyltransferase